MLPAPPRTDSMNGAMDTDHEQVRLTIAARPCAMQRLPGLAYGAPEAGATQAAACRADSGHHRVTVHAPRSLS